MKDIAFEGVRIRGGILETQLEFLFKSMHLLR